MTTQETILKLRDRAGYWCGDTVAEKVLEEYRASQVSDALAAQRQASDALAKADAERDALAKINKGLEAENTELRLRVEQRKVPATQGATEL